jgi:hypothetical protein
LSGNDSPQITASLTAVDGAVLLLRCKEKGTDVLVAKPMTYLGSESIKVITRINDGKPNRSGLASFNKRTGGFRSRRNSIYSCFT